MLSLCCLPFEDTTLLSLLRSICRVLNSRGHDSIHLPHPPCTGALSTSNRGLWQVVLLAVICLCERLLKLVDCCVEDGLFLSAMEHTRH